MPGAKCRSLTFFSFRVVGESCWSVGDTVGLELNVSCNIPLRQRDERAKHQGLMDRPPALPPSETHFACAIFFASSAFCPIAAPGTAGSTVWPGITSLAGCQLQTPV